MAAPRRTTRQAAPPNPNFSPALAVGGAVLAIPIIAFGFPGLVVTWAMLLAAAWIAVPAQFTGKKDSAGFPTAAHPGETRSMQRYRFWADLKYRLIVPPSAFLPGWPVYASWLYAIVAAAAVWCLPYRDLPYVGLWFRHVDAFFAAVIVTQVAAARRRTVSAIEPSPGVSLRDLFLLGRKPGATERERNEIFLTAGAAVAGAMVGAATCGMFISTPPLPEPFATGAWWGIGGFLGFGAGIAWWWVNVALFEWRTLVAAREEWAPRWQTLKHDPAPVLIMREQVGNATVDHFTAPGSMGSIGYWLLGPKVTQTVGGGRRLAILSEEDVDGQGQPQPGTRHPLNFQIVQWASGQTPNVADIDSNESEMRLFLQCVAVWAADGAGFARPILNEMQSIALAEPLPAESDEDNEADSDDPGSIQDLSPTNVYATTWFLPDGPPMPYIRKDLRGALSGHAEQQVLVDHRSQVIFFGPLLDAGTIYDPRSGISDEDLRKLATEDEWNDRWTAALKQDVNPPTIEHATYLEDALAEGPVVHQQAFITRNGVTPEEFFNLEGKIAATLNGAPFVAVTGWAATGRIGERHPQAFTVYWSSQTVPANPDKLSPPPSEGDRGRSARPRRQSPVRSQKWVLAGRMNEAFRQARLAKPELYAARCLTTPQSRGGHIWKMPMRLYGGVTLADVRGASERIRQALGSEWLRVESAPDGCIIVAGASPSKVRLVDPDGDLRYIESLNWEQAFLDAKVIGVGGVTPVLTAVDRLPHNEQVQVLDFTLPTGLSFADVRAAAKKLETATANSFVDVRLAPSGRADAFRILASETNPMPATADVDFDVMDSADGIPFATGVEGEPVIFDPKDSPHALLAGVTGSGKAQPLNTPVPVPVSQRFPLGWAPLGELAIGDEVYAVDGSVTRVNGLSPITEEVTYSFIFSDGRVAHSAANHLWKVSSSASRREYAPSKVGTRSARRVEWDQWVASIRSEATKIGSQTLLSLPDISRLAGLGNTGIYRYPLSLEHLSFPMQVAVNRDAKVFHVEALAQRWEQKALAGTPTRLHGHAVTVDDVATLRRAAGVMEGHLTIRAIAAAVTASTTDGTPTRVACRAVRSWVARHQLDHRRGRSTSTITVYPADEVLTQLADLAEAAGPARAQDGARPLTELLTTAEISERGAGERFAIPYHQAIQGDRLELPVDPYTLGAWLGDGTQRHGSITSADPEVIARVEAAGYRVRRVEQTGTRAPTFHFDDLTPDLRSAGIDVHRIRGCNKRIPTTYLRASVEQRLDVLRGLMDTDGTIDKGGHCELALSDASLASDALHLIRSLGIKASVIVAASGYRNGDGDRVACSERHRIHFTTNLGVFTLARKAARLPVPEPRTHEWTYLDRVEVGGVRPMRCISVEHPQHLYLTDDFVATHNSVLITDFVYGFLVRGAHVYVIDPVKGGADFMWARDRCKAFASTPFEAAGVMKAVYDEVVRRKNLNAAHGVASYLDLPDPPPPIVVVLDEFTSLMGKSPVPDVSDDMDTQREREYLLAENQAKAVVGTFTGKLAREARSAGVTVLLGTQKLTAKMLDSVPGGNDLKTNLARVLLGNGSSGDRASAFRAPESAPQLTGGIPKGRGLWESLTSSSAVMIQTWYASPATLGTQLASRVPPLDPSEMLDVSQFTAPETEISGSIIIDDDGPSVADVPQVRDLGVIEFTLEDFEAMSLRAVGDADPEPSVVDAPGDPEDPSDAVPVESSIVWDEIDPETWQPETSRYGWVEVDALLNFLDDFPHVVEVEWADPNLDSTTADGTLFRDLVAALLAARSVSLVEMTATASGEPDPADPHVDWDVVDSTTWHPATSEYGWVEVDALVAYLVDFPSVETVSWNDPRLDEDDEIGVPFHEVVVDLLNERGVALQRSQASTAVDETMVVDEPDHDEWALPALPAHLRPTHDSDW